MIYKIVRRILRNDKIHRWLKKIYHANADTVVDTGSLAVDIPEISVLGARQSPLTERRLNLVVPALSLKHVFGGIATALNFFHELLPEGMDARIIVTDESAFGHESNGNYAHWHIRTLDDDDCRGLVVVCAGDRYQKQLALRKYDVFIATAWWTAIVAQNLIREKRRFYGVDDKDRLIYLIQDFEPGFYPWSSRYALAESTYRDADNVIPVFNTSILKEYFDRNGYSFGCEFVFEPVLNEGLRSFCGVSGCERERKVIVYGRPGVSRNIFEVLIMSLRQAVSSHDFSGWSFYSAGEVHSKIDLGKGFELISLGKLPLNDYAQMLSTAYAGISLMVSPHPSYPPLEMSAFGVKVITNNYANKKLHNFSPNILAVDSLSPTSVAEKLIEVVKGYDAQNCDFGGDKTTMMLNFIGKKNPFGDIIPAIRGMVFH